MANYKKRLALLAACLAIAVGLCIAVPNFLGYDLAYKNEKMDVHVPAETVTEDVAETNFTLPVIYIYSYDLSKLLPRWNWSPDGPAMPLREWSTVDLYVFERDVNNLNDIPSHVYSSASMKLRGRTSSYAQAKKPFSLKFSDEDGNANNFTFLSLKADSDFVFHAPYIDRSLARNYVAYNLEKQVLDWAPDCRYAEVFIDTPDTELSMGDYVGVYLVVEKIKQGKNRLALGKFTVADNPDKQFEKGGNYIFKRDAYEEGYDSAIRLPENRYGNTYSLVYPKADDVTDEDVRVISDEISKYETALYNGTDKEFAKYYDIEQIARCVLVDEFVKNFEGFTSSFYYYRAKGDKIKAVQWDFDLGTGNVDYAEDLSNAHGFFTLECDPIKPYLRHDNFKQELIRQYKLLRSEGGALSEENIIAMFDDIENQLDGAWQRNDRAYSEIFGGYVFGNAENDLKNSYEERQYILQFLIERGRWLDEHIDEINFM